MVISSDLHLLLFTKANVLARDGCCFRLFAASALLSLLLYDKVGFKAICTKNKVTFHVELHFVRIRVGTLIAFYA